jgi:hypothetical protein
MNFSAQHPPHDDLEAVPSRSRLERLVLIPLGVATILGEELIGQLASLSSRARAERQVRLLEDRGQIERARIEQEIRRHRSKLVHELDTHAEQLRNTIRDLASKGCNFASKIRREMPTNP